MVLPPGAKDWSQGVRESGSQGDRESANPAQLSVIMGDEGQQSTTPTQIQEMTKSFHFVNRNPHFLGPKNRDFRRFVVKISARRVKIFPLLTNALLMFLGTRIHPLNPQDILLFTRNH
jgi:hypothetical protein